MDLSLEIEFHTGWVLWWAWNFFLSSALCFGLLN